MTPKSWTNILFVNTAIFLICLLILEIIFGYWFSEFNLGPYMREHRLKKIPVVLLYNNKTYNYIYKRNYHGFRGEEINPSKIEAMISDKTKAVCIPNLIGNIAKWDKINKICSIN